jgi:hypothetical protein
MNGILTVGELKAILAKHSDDTQIVTTNDEGWFSNIAQVIEPDGNSYFAITLETANTFDARQF